MRPSTVTSLPFLIFSSLLISPGTANLNGQNPSLESHALSHCIAADNSSSASGTTFFTSPLVNNGSTQLSWTLGVHIQNSSDDTGRNKLIQIERDFYFGLGSDPGSIQNASFRACSIFYHGASEPLYSDANPDGRRTQELSDDCVRDLTALVNNTAQELMPRNDDDLSNVCKKLVETTTGNRPTSCQNYNLGELHFQAFTNRNTSSTSSSGNCHSSSGGDYNLTLVDSNSFVNANGSTNLKNMVLGATPIITVFYPESNLSRPDIQYVALKPEDTSNLIGQSKPKSPGQQPCKRTGTCDQGYTISNVNYAEKGRVLVNNLRENNQHPETDDHNFAEAEKKYSVKAIKKTSPILGSKISLWMKENMEISMGKSIFEKGSSWTRYEVWGATKPDPTIPTVAEVYVSVKHRAILANRLFRENDKLYKNGLELKDRLPMPDYGVDVKLSDLKVIVGTDVDNAEAKAIVAKAQQEVGGNNVRFTVRASDGEPFEALAASSSGKSKYYMLADHNGPSELNKLVPQKAKISLEDDGGLPAITWILGRD
ncbi:hypothetical protein IFM61392_01364 [Aspergillus lentulus]|nr:hypothetical protein IFM61392_01364 [Aspergillus lentulus]